MPAKLIIPSVELDRPPLRWSVALRRRGAEGRRIERAKLDQLAKNRESRLWIVMTIAVLWGLFWLQFVIGIMYDMPALYTLSGGNWYPPAIEFYDETSEPFPWSLAGTFVMFSLLASALGMAGAWWGTQGVPGKWRMRFVVLLFSTIVCGWSYAGLKAEDGKWIGVENRIARAREQWRRAAYSGDEEWWLRRYREEVERWEKLLQTRPDRKGND
jgi:hypothetical protein